MERCCLITDNIVFKLERSSYQLSRGNPYNKGGNYQITCDGAMPLFQLRIFSENQKVVAEHWLLHVVVLFYCSSEKGAAPPGWLSGERVRLMTNLLSGEFSPFTFAEACEKSSQ